MFKNRKTMVRVGAALAVALIALIFVQFVFAQGARSNRQADNIVQTIGTPVDAITVSGSHINVTVTGGDDPTTTEATWFGGIAAAALAAQEPGLSDASLVSSTTDGAASRDVTFNAQGNLASTPADMTTLNQWISDARGRASADGVTITGARVIPYFAGAIDITLKPFDPTDFVTSAGEKVASILGPLVGPGRAYFVDVVDGSGKPLLMLSFNPSVGGDTGQGTAWVTPNLQTDAVWGGINSTGQTLTPSSGP